MVKTLQQIKRVTHSFYSGLGGHTSVFWALEKYAAENFYCFTTALYGIELPLHATIQKLTDNNIGYDVIKKNGRFDIFHSFRLAFKIKKNKPNIIFLHGSYGILIIYAFCCLFGKAKLVVRETQALNLKTKREKANALIALLLSDRLVFLTDDYQQQFLNSFFKSAYKDKTCVIENGLDLDVYKPAEKSRADETITIGMQSRLVGIKDHKTLIAAIKVLTDKGYNKIRLLIAGEGPTYKELEEIILELKIQEKVQLLGLIELAEIPQFLNSLNIYVHSSLGETMSNAIMQAQSCGLPIVATNVFGINNVITDKENGFLFDLGDVHALAEILEYLILDEAARISYGLISREYAVTHLSDKVMADKYYQIFNELESVAK